MHTIIPPTAVFFPHGYDYKTWLADRNLPQPDAFHGPTLCFSCNDQFPNWIITIDSFPPVIRSTDLTAVGARSTRAPLMQPSCHSPLTTHHSPLTTNH
jgi:hypothetical protein